MTSLKPIRTLSTAAAASVLLMTAACGGSDDPASSTPDTSSTSSEAPTDDAPEPAGDFEDGSYSGEGSYSNPGGVSSVTVELELADNTIEQIDVQPGASGTSLQFQQKFISGIADEVVGKRIDEINVSQVAGSSLTSQGFNEAIEQIKADASA